MKVVTYSHARDSLKSVLDGVVQDADITIISRRDAEGDTNRLVYRATDIELVIIACRFHYGD
jgi:hypothetical protein